MSDAELNRLKVAELKEELKKRGVDTKGNKAQLVQKLKVAIERERNRIGTEGSDAPGAEAAFEGLRSVDYFSFAC